MSWVIVATGIVGLFVAVLAVPLHVDLRIELTDRLRARATLRWFFDLMHVAIPSRRGADATSRHAARPATATPSRARRPGRRPNVLAVLRSRGFVRRVGRFVEDLAGAIHLSRLVVRARIGCDDPADTGHLCGVLMPVVAAASATGVDVRCVPDFAHTTVTGAGSGTVTVTPLRLVLVVLAFMASPPVWRAIRAWRRQS